MGIKKFIMKQYWRIGTIRALLSLALAMLVIGRLYYQFIPGLKDMGMYGALILGTFLVFIFMGIGWAYDVKAKMWSQKEQAITERNAYSYIPSYWEIVVHYAIYRSMVRTFKQILSKNGLDSDYLDDAQRYLDGYFGRKLTREDIFSSLSAGLAFCQKHPFSTTTSQEQKRVPIRSRIKLGFQVMMLRLNWIQSLTGLVQEVLVFGTFFIALIYLQGKEVVDEILPFDILVIGFFLVSIPLFAVLVSLGWLYDRKFKIWAPDFVVRIERNPYTYLAEPKLHVMYFPFYFALLQTMKKIFISHQMDVTELDRIQQFLGSYQNLDVAKDEHMIIAKELRKTYGELFGNQKRGH